jgi:hypothetical protein
MKSYKYATAVIAGAPVSLSGRGLIRANDKGAASVEVETVNPDGSTSLSELVLPVGRVVEVDFVGIEVLSGSVVALS